MVKRLPAMRETQVRFLSLEDPLEKEMATTPVFLPGESHGWRSQVGYSPWGCKESDTTEHLHFHSNILINNNEKDLHSYYILSNYLPGTNLST